MNVMGYLITLANLQNLENSAGPLKKLSVKVAETQFLTNQLKSHPEFALEGFKKTGYSKVGNVGMYLSRNLRDYIYHGLGKPTDEAVLLTLVFKDGYSGDSSLVKAPIRAVNTAPDPNLSYFLHRGHVDDNLKKGIDDYANTINSHARNKRTLISP
ncbi:uncharacterized protein LOC131850519 [Achroia grisella]|uniref:uncharacterized protein LOC131850519 n=1 Tax=Achroia grisella TaxID=688607 RepID=UPI0027D30270|nr:uncharacterized protein LOC131850519 [Achroia grisella]